MQKLSFLLLVITTISFFACNNNPNNGPTASKTKETEPIAAATIVGIWEWAGSADDENHNGQPDAGEWHYRDAAIEKEYAAMNVSLNILDLNFNIDGTGFVGTAPNDSTKFTWTAKAANNQFTAQNVQDKSISQFYIDAKGELIVKNTGQMTAAGQKREQTTFEIFKKQ